MCLRFVPFLHFFKRYFSPLQLLNNYSTMPRNVEIKATIPGDFQEFIKVANSLSDTEACSWEQEDTFFKVPNGRLKFRRQEGKENFLIFYDRSDTEGPKLSNYELSVVPDDSNLDSLLIRALGTVGVVRKTRTLCMVGQTRVHIDQVEGLGNFMELEVVLRDDQTVEEGQDIAEKLMKLLGISKENLQDGAYMDFLLKKM